jgi:acetyl-CoA acetyltransferase
MTAYLVGEVRTPLGRYGGALAKVRPHDLAALVVSEAVRRAGVDPAAIDEVILGAANQAGQDNRKPEWPRCRPGCPPRYPCLLR